MAWIVCSQPVALTLNEATSRDLEYRCSCEKSLDVPCFCPMLTMVVFCQFHCSRQSLRSPLRFCSSTPRGTYYLHQRLQPIYSFRLRWLFHIASFSSEPNGIHIPHLVLVVNVPHPITEKSLATAF